MPSATGDSANSDDLGTGCHQTITLLDHPPNLLAGESEVERMEILAGDGNRFIWKFQGDPGRGVFHSFEKGVGQEEARLSLVELNPNCPFLNGKCIFNSGVSLQWVGDMIEIAWWSRCQ